MTPFVTADPCYQDHTTVTNGLVLPSATFEHTIRASTSDVQSERVATRASELFRAAVYQGAHVTPTIERSSTMPEWLALQVWSGREHQCGARLEARGYEVFVPAYDERRRWTDRIRVIKRALFSGYVFCRISFDVVAKIVTTPGVVRIVGDGHGPLPIDRSEIDALQRLVASGFASEPLDYLQAGQRVRVRAGPLADCEGVVVEHKSRHCLVISVSLLQRSVAVQIDHAFLEPVPWRACAGTGVSALRRQRV